MRSPRTSSQCGWATESVTEKRHAGPHHPAPRKAEDTAHPPEKQKVNRREAKLEKKKPHEIVLTYVKNKGIHSFTHSFFLPFQWMLISEPTMGLCQALGIRRIIPALMELSVFCREIDLLIRKKWQDMMINEIREVKETVNQGCHLLSAKQVVGQSTEMGNSKGKLSSARGRWWVPSWTSIHCRGTQHLMGVRAGVIYHLYHRWYLPLSPVGLWIRKWRISTGNGHDLKCLYQKWITYSFPTAFT